MDKKTAKDIRELTATYTQVSDPVVNGYIYRLFLENKCKFAKSCAVLIGEMKLYHPKSPNDLKRLQRCIKNVSITMDKFRKTPDKSWKNIVDFLNHFFRYQPSDDDYTSNTFSTTKSFLTASVKEEFRDETPHLDMTSVDKLVDPPQPVEIFSLSSCYSYSQNNIFSTLSRCPMTGSSISAKRVSKCAQCRVKRDAIRVLQEKNRELKTKITKLKSILKQEKYKNKQLTRKPSTNL